MLTATGEPLLLALNVDDALRLYRVRSFERLAVFGSVLCSPARGRAANIRFGVGLQR